MKCLKEDILLTDVIYVSVAHTKKEIVKYLKNLEEVFSLLKKINKFSIIVEARFNSSRLPLQILYKIGKYSFRIFNKKD